MKDTKIEWADHTINFWWGCTKVSPGCANCYAEGLDKRWHGGEHWGKGAPRKPRLEAARKEALALNRKAEREGRQYRIFANSMNDWLDPEVPIEWLAEMLDTIRQTPNLSWMLLTKRPELWEGRMGETYNSILREGDSASELSDSIWLWLFSNTPPPNVWIGASVEDQARADERIPALVTIPAKIRFLSCEPLLGPVDVNILGIEYGEQGESPNIIDCWHPDRISWVICGGESGHGARPMRPDWARSLRDQCQAGGVAFFMKQMGGVRKPFAEIPHDLMIREFPIQLPEESQ